MSLAKKAFEGSFSISAGQATDILLGLVVTLILVRLLSVGEYGSYILVLSVMTFVAGFADLGISNLVSSRVGGFVGGKKFRETRGFLSGYAKFMFALSAIGFLAVFALADYISLWLTVDIASLLRFAAVLVFFQSAHTFFVYSLLAHTEFFDTLKMTLSLEGSRLIFVIGFVYFFGLGLGGAVAAYLLSFVVSATVGGLLFLKKVRKGISGVKGKKVFKKIMKKEGSFVAGSSILKLLRANAIVWIIAAMAGTEYVAFYSIAITILSAFLIPLTAMESTLYPLISRTLAKSAKTGRILYNKSIKYASMLSVGLAILLIIFVEPLVELIFTKDYVFSLFFYQVLAIVVITQGLWVSIRPLLYAKAKQKQAFLANVIIVATLLVLAVLLVPINPKLATSAFVVANLAGFVYYWFAVRKMGFSISVRALARTDKYDRMILSRIKKLFRL